MSRSTKESQEGNIVIVVVVVIFIPVDRYNRRESEKI